MGSAVLRAFYVQYVALLLIILSCLVGGTAVGKLEPKPLPPADVYLSKRLSTIALPSLTDDGDLSNEDKKTLEAVAVLLSQHDLVAKIIVATKRDPLTFNWRKSFLIELQELGLTPQGIELNTSSSISSSEIQVFENSHAYNRT